MKIKITLNLEQPQKIKFTDITTITRVGNTQKKVIKRNSAGIVLEKGCNEVDIKVYHQIEKSPWFVRLVDRKDIVVEGVPVEKVVAPVTVTKVVKKTVTKSVNVGTKK